MASAEAFPVKTPMDQAASILCISDFIKGIVHGFEQAQPAGFVPIGAQQMGGVANGWGGWWQGYCV